MTIWNKKINKIKLIKYYHVYVKNNIFLLVILFN